MTDPPRISLTVEEYQALIELVVTASKAVQDMALELAIAQHRIRLLEEGGEPAYN